MEIGVDITPIIIFSLFQELIAYEYNFKLRSMMNQKMESQGWDSYGVCSLERAMNQTPVSFSGHLDFKRLELPRDADWAESLFHSC